MIPTTFVADLIRAGVVLETQDGQNIHVNGQRQSLTPELLSEIRGRKGAILSILRTPAQSAASEWSGDWRRVFRPQDNQCILASPASLASPPAAGDVLATAHHAYESAMDAVAVGYDAMLAVGQQPPKLAPEVERPLDDAIAERFRARDAEGAIKGIAAWKKAWLDLLERHQKPPAGPRTAVEHAARRLDATRLMDLANDPSIPEADREEYRAEVHARAQALIDESEGHRPHPNQRVWDMFARADRQFGGREGGAVTR
jgi:hypothetical protein